jgi:hypothetical protein
LFALAALVQQRDGGWFFGVLVLLYIAMAYALTSVIDALSASVSPAGAPPCRCPWTPVPLPL